MPAPDQSEFYQPLTGSSTIRLLHRAGVDNEVAQYTLEEHDLKSCPPFVALSYTWNPPYFKDFDEPSNSNDLSFSAWFGINSKLFQATQNMKDALDCALTKAKQEYIWMDQCCINQASSTERSSQVSLMHRIYEQADLVLVWLGGCHPFATSFHWMVTDFNLMVQKWIKRSGADFVFSFPPETIVEVEGKTRHEFKKHLLEAEQFHLLCRFFERTWVRHEVVLAKRLQIFCGDLVIPRDGITNLHYYFNNTGWSIQAHHYREEAQARRAAAFASFGLWFTVNEAYRKGTSSVICGSIANPVLPYLQYKTPEAAAITGLWQIITRLQSSTCSDPRDKIYAALPLAMKMYSSANVKMPIIPRYDVSAEQLYTTFCIDTIRLTSSLNILTRVDVISERELTLPSWVKDFSSKRIETRTEFFPGNVYQNHILSLGLRSTVRFISDRLITFGTPLATIAKRTSDPRIDSKYEYAQSLLRLIAVGPGHLDGVPRVEALWKTMLADTGHENDISRGSDTHYAVSPAPNETFNCFWSWLIKDLVATYEEKVRRGESLKEVLSWLVRLLLPFPGEIANHQLPSPLTILYWVQLYTKSNPRNLGIMEKHRSSLSMFESMAQDHKFYPLFLTKENFIGSGPLDLEVGDEIWFVHSCNVPLLLRPKTEQGTFSLVGPCYLHGFMHHTHMFDPGYDFVNKWRRFTLV